MNQIFLMSRYSLANKMNGSQLFTCSRPRAIISWLMTTVSSWTKMLSIRLIHFHCWNYVDSSTHWEKWVIEEEVIIKSKGKKAKCTVHYSSAINSHFVQLKTEHHQDVKYVTNQASLPKLSGKKIIKRNNEKSHKLKSIYEFLRICPHGLSMTILIF